MSYLKQQYKVASVFVVLVILFAIMALASSRNEWVPASLPEVSFPDWPVLE